MKKAAWDLSSGEVSQTGCRTGQRSQNPDITTASNPPNERLLVYSTEVILTLAAELFEQTPGDSEGQGSLACCGPRGHRKSDMTEQLNNNNNKWQKVKRN